MPRETINNAASDGFQVEVGWAASGTGNDVQLGIETTGGRSLLTVLYGGDAQLERIGNEVAGIGCQPLTKSDAQAFGRQVLDVVQGGPDSKAPDEAMPQWGYRSVWVHLNRYGCNRLVKVVRRARGGVFGGDE